jgi:hypothetical protein
LNSGLKVLWTSLLVKTSHSLTRARARVPGRGARSEPALLSARNWVMGGAFGEDFAVAKAERRHVAFWIDLVEVPSVVGFVGLGGDLHPG